MLNAIKRLEDQYEKVDVALLTATGSRAESLKRTKESLNRQILALYDAAISRANG